MIVAVGSQNKAKVASAGQALQRLSQAFRQGLDDTFSILTAATVTSVADMPLSQKEMRQGALQRALFVYRYFTEKKTAIDFALGLEGGVYRFAGDDTAYLQNWVYAYNGTKGFFGSSASLPLPQEICHALFDEGRELAEVIDRMTGLEDVRSNEGAFGILTRNLLTRSQSFEQAIVNAMVPFLNQRYYGQ